MKYPKGKAPKVRQEDVTAAITGEFFTVLPDGRTTVCTLQLDNGFTVQGQSSCVRAENFDADVGRKVARAAAEGEVWKFLGFRLADKLHAEAAAQPAQD